MRTNRGYSSPGVSLTSYMDNNAVIIGMDLGNNRPFQSNIRYIVNGPDAPNYTQPPGIRHPVYYDRMMQVEIPHISRLPNSP